MAHVRGSAHVAATTVLLIMSMLFHCEAADTTLIWTTGVKYDVQQLKTGDTLTFYYKRFKGYNVEMVSQTDYNDCETARGTFSPGPPTTLTFPDPGTFFYICSGNGTCVKGETNTMKVQVNVTKGRS